jgi:hypothetical protein
METKVCSKCNEELDVTNFNKCGKDNDRLRGWCKACYKQYKEAWKTKNKDKITAYNEKYKIDNKDLIKQRNDEWHRTHKEEEREYKKEHFKEYYAKNKDRINEKGKRHYINNKSRYRQLSKEWAINNKDKVNISSQIRRMKKKELPYNLSEEQWVQIKNDFDNKCAYCGQEMPLAQEHFVALSKGGEYTINNIVPSCQSCNSSKSDKDFFEWYPKYRHYDKNREKFILKYLNYNNGIQQLALII